MPSSSENGPSSEPEKKQEEEPSTKRRKITPRIDLGEVTDKNIGQLKLLNSVIFPVQYRETFYKDVLAFPELTRLGSVFLLLSLSLFSLLIFYFQTFFFLSTNTFEDIF